MKKVLALTLASSLLISFAANATGATQADGTYICTSNVIGLEAPSDIEAGTIHHLIVAHDFSQVQVFLVAPNGDSAATPIVLKQSSANSYFVMFGKDQFPKVVDAPSASIDRSIADAQPLATFASYTNNGRSETIECLESIPE